MRIARSLSNISLYDVWRQNSRAFFQTKKKSIHNKLKCCLRVFGQRKCVLLMICLHSRLLERTSSVLTYLFWKTAKRGFITSGALSVLQIFKLYPLPRQALIVFLRVELESYPRFVYVSKKGSFDFKGFLFDEVPVSQIINKWLRYEFKRLCVLQSRTNVALTQEITIRHRSDRQHSIPRLQTREISELKKKCCLITQMCN